MRYIFQHLSAYSKLKPRVQLNASLIRVSAPVETQKSNQPVQQATSSVVTGTNNFGTNNMNYLNMVNNAAADANVVAGHPPQKKESSDSTTTIFIVLAVVFGAALIYVVANKQKQGAAKDSNMDQNASHYAAKVQHYSEEDIANMAQ